MTVERDARLPQKTLAQFWIDVGGTFTDCFCRTPDGQLRRHKLLSSGRTHGVAADGSTARGAFSIQLAAAILHGSGSATVATDRLGRARARIPTGERLRRVGGAARVLKGELQTSPPAGFAYELASDEEAPLVAIRYLLGLRRDAEIPPAEVRLGTTRGTNALLTRRGAATALVTTRGFADILQIGYQNRPRLFDLDIVKPTPLTAAVVEIDERVAADGEVLRAADPEEIRVRLAPLRESGIESVAICLLHATTFAEHERLVAAIAAEMGFSEISVSHQVASLGKLVSRGDTTVLDAYLNPVLRRYVGGARVSDRRRSDCA